MQHLSRRFVVKRRGRIFWGKESVWLAFSLLFILATLSTITVAIFSLPHEHTQQATQNLRTTYPKSGSQSQASLVKSGDRDRRQIRNALADDVFNTIDRAVMYLIHSIRSDDNGRFRYVLEAPAIRNDISAHLDGSLMKRADACNMKSYNLLRHAGALYSLIMLESAFPGSMPIARTESAVQWLLQPSQMHARPHCLVSWQCGVATQAKQNWAAHL